MAYIEIPTRSHRDVNSAADINQLMDNIEFLNTLIPVGAKIMFGSASTPENFLYCDGSAVSRTTYAALFAVIGTTYGAGNGSTTFNIPNTQGVVPKGVGSQTINTRSKSGPALGVVEEDQGQGHYHNKNTSGLTEYILYSGAGSFNWVAGSNGFSNAVTTGAAVSDGTNGTPRTGAATRENSIGVRYYIRYK